jgi:class 3 adenylate cyclase
VQGDTANTTARLGSAAAAGELVMSEQIVAAAGTDIADLTRRILDVKGKADPIPVWVDVPTG